MVFFHVQMEKGSGSNLTFFFAVYLSEIKCDDSSVDCDEDDDNDGKTEAWFFLLSLQFCLPSSTPPPHRTAGPARSLRISLVDQQRSNLFSGQFTLWQNIQHWKKMVLGKGGNGKYQESSQRKEKKYSMVFVDLLLYFVHCFGCSAILFRFLLFDLCVYCVWVCICVCFWVSLFSFQLFERGVRNRTAEEGGNNGKVSVK